MFQVWTGKGVLATIFFAGFMGAPTSPSAFVVLK